MMGFDGTPPTSPRGGKDCHPGSVASHRIPAGEKLSSLGPEQDAVGSTYEPKEAFPRGEGGLCFGNGGGGEVPDDDVLQEVSRSDSGRENV